MSFQNIWAHRQALWQAGYSVELHADCLKLQKYWMAFSAHSRTRYIHLWVNKPGILVLGLQAHHRSLRDAPRAQGQISPFWSLLKSVRSKMSKDVERQWSISIRRKPSALTLFVRRCRIRYIRPWGSLICTAWGPFPARVEAASKISTRYTKRGIIRMIPYVTNVWVSKCQPTVVIGERSWRNAQGFQAWTRRSKMYGFDQSRDT